MPEVTHNPQGDYPQPAAVHQFDIELEADRLIAQLGGHGHQSRTLAREAGVSLVLMALEGGDAVPEHATHGATSIMPVRGHTVVTIGGEDADLRPGALVFLQPNVRHEIRAEEQSVVLLTISGGSA